MGVYDFNIRLHACMTLACNCNACCVADHVMTTGKDDLTKKTQLGSKIGYPGCPTCGPLVLI